MHLDVRSWYSFHDGVASPAELCAHAAELGFAELGIADIDGTYGLIQFYKAAMKAGVKPILGIALTDLTGSAAVSAAAQVTGDRLQVTDKPSRSEAVLRPSGVDEERAMHGIAPTEDGGHALPHDSGLPTSDLGPRTSDFRQDGGHGGPPHQDGGQGRPPHHQEAEPAAWVYARDRDGYSELCWLAAWRQGCLGEGTGNREQGTGKREGFRSQDAGLAQVLAERTEHCFVVSDHERLLSHLAPRLGPQRLFVRTDANYGESYRARQIRQLKLAARYGLAPAAMSDVRFLRPQDQAVHHTLRAIGQNATLYTAQGVRPRQHYLAAPTELPGYYYDCPQALATTRRLAERCEVDFELGRWVFPDFPLKGGADPRSVLLQLCERGLSWRGIGGGGAGGSPAGNAGRLAACPTDYAARLEMELRVIEQLGYTSYFLAVYDIVREATRRRIPHVGRGSAANSLVSYLLGLTPVDPLRYDMYFERFLNPQRTSPPDIDIDFNWKRRDEILSYVYQRWGSGRVAMISTHVTYRARSAVREVAKVFGLGDAEIGAVSKFLPHIAASDLPSAQRDFPELRGIDFTSEPYCHVLPLASRLDGKPRHLGIHCGGIVIAPTRITDYTGLQRAAKGFVVTQYDMFPVEDVGLIKIDLLGNRSLGVLEDTLASIGREQGTGNREGFRIQDSGCGAGENTSSGGGTPPDNDGRRDAAPTITSDIGLRTSDSPVDIHRVISDWEALATDEATVALIREGLTIGCFYIESPGMRQLLRRLRTRTFLDLTAASSVIRPGVAESGMMQEYIRRVRGEAGKMPTHPLMREIMPETHGVMIYQEDVIKVAHRLAGMSLADADLLRRAMSGKLRSQSAMNQIRERFIGGCEHNGLDIASALEIWRQVASFAGYSFCKAHSASFATLSFQVAYLKAHYPAHFLAAVLSNGGGFYGPRAYLSECERLGLRVLPPDVNFSRLEYTAEKTGNREQGTGNREEQDPVGAASRRPPQVGPDSVPVKQIQGSGESYSPSAPMGRGREEASRLPAGSVPCSLFPVPFPHNAVRVGLAVIKGAGAALLARVVAERERGGLYRSLPDFIRRTRPGLSDLAILIKCGALDSLGLSRPELLWLAQIERKANVRASGGRPSLAAIPSGADRRVRHPSRTEPSAPLESPAGTRALHDQTPLPLDDSARIADFRARIGSTLDGYSEHKLCELELQHLGMLVRRHPLTLFAHLSAGLTCARDLPRHAGRWVRLLGWCIAVKRVDLTHRQSVRDTLELQAEHADRPEPSPTDERDELDDEREGTAEDLGIVLRAPARQNPVGTASRRPPMSGGGTPPPPAESGGRRAMKFMSMEDLTGTFEVTLFADAYARFAHLTRYAGPFLVTGKVEEQFDTYTINATGLQLLSLDEDGLPPPTGYRDGAVRTVGRANQKPR